MVPRTTLVLLVQRQLDSVFYVHVNDGSNFVTIIRNLMEQTMWHGVNPCVDH